jgi:gliding motility-associated-like protein
MRKLLCLFLIGSTLSSFGQNQMHISTGTFVTADNAFINLDDTNIINEGTIRTTSANLVINATQTIALQGAGIYELHRLILNTTDVLSIEQNVFLNEQLIFNQGRVNLNDSRVDLGEALGELIGETDDNYLYADGSGIIVKPFSFDLPADLNPGNLGLSLSSTENLGASEIIRAHEVLSLPGGAQSIRRSYEVSTATPNNDAVNITAYYRNHEADPRMTTPVIWQIDESQTSPLAPISQSVDPLRGNLVVSDTRLINAIFTIGEDSPEIDVASIPTAFTPNGDGRNDTFIIPFLASQPEALVMIFSRWGERIYSSTNYVNEPWDGTWKGKVLSTNTFYYKIKLADRKKTIDGTISIVK